MIKLTFQKHFPLWYLDDNLQLGYRGKKVTMETSKLGGYENSVREGGREVREAVREKESEEKEREE